MVIGHHENLNLKFDGNEIEEVENYKYLGNIFRSVGRVNEDIFRDTYPYLSGQGRGAIFGICLNSTSSSYVQIIWDAC